MTRHDRARALREWLYEVLDVECSCEIDDFQCAHRWSGDVEERIIAALAEDAAEAVAVEWDACATVVASLPGYGDPVAGGDDFYAGYWEAAQDAVAAIRARGDATGAIHG